MKKKKYIGVGYNSDSDSNCEKNSFNKPDSVGVGVIIGSRSSLQDPSLRTGCAWNQ